MDIEHLFKLMTVMSKTQVSSEVEDKVKELIINYNGVEPVTHPQLDRSKFVLSNRFRLSFGGC